MEKKSDANVNRKFGIMKWSQSPGKKRWEVNILSWKVGKVVFPTQTPGKWILKDNEQRQTLAYKDAGQRRDAEINK